MLVMDELSGVKEIEVEKMKQRKKLRALSYC
jgi:hypothetical protein